MALHGTSGGTMMRSMGFMVVAGLLVLTSCSLDRTPTLAESAGGALGTGAMATGSGATASSGGFILTGGRVQTQTGGCSGPGCAAKLDNGGSCVADMDCKSGHCDNGLCCLSGDCCRSVGDCGVDALVCDHPSTCQGRRRAQVCAGFTCMLGDAEEDDSACGAGLIADDCDVYPDLTCAGGKAQTAGRCASSCEKDEDCDADGHCTEQACVADFADGSDCSEDRECLSGHCGDGVCCADGDCCKVASDCHIDYASPPSCDLPSLCQGSRMDAMCEDFMCATGPRLEDDSACTPDVLARDCGDGRDYLCNGQSVQALAQCSLFCGRDADCDPAAYCGSPSARCTADLADGAACVRDAQCMSNHCSNGMCCASGDCCQEASDCPVEDYGRPPVCVNVQTCRGLRADPVCQAFRCEQVAASISDPSGCMGEVALPCGSYADVICNGAPNQTVECTFACTTQDDCDPDMTCLPNGSCG